MSAATDIDKLLEGVDSNMEIDSAREEELLGDASCNSVESTSKVVRGNSTEESNDSSSQTKHRSTSPGGVATRASRRAKNKKNVDEGLKKEEHVELKETTKKRGTALTNASNKRAQIQIGKAFQAPPVPEVDPSMAELDEDRDTLVWTNDHMKVTEPQLDEFLDEAVGVYRLSMDRALFILRQNEYDLPAARKEVATKKVVEEEWNDDDKILFRMSYQQYGKNFAKIRQVMPYRSIASLIQHYYQMKKRWKDKSYIQDLEASEIVNDASADDPSKPDRRGGRRNKNAFFPGYNELLGELPNLESLTEEFLNGICSNCAQESASIRDIGVAGSMVIGDPKLVSRRLCLACSLYYEQTGKIRDAPDVIQALREYEQKFARLPKNPDYKAVINEFKHFATLLDDSSEREEGANAIKVTQKLKTRGSIECQNVRQACDEQKALCLRMEAVLEKDFLKIPDMIHYKSLLKEYKVKNQGRKKDEWTDQEKFFASRAFVRYGSNFNAVAEIVQTKNVLQVKKFYDENQAVMDNFVGQLDAYLISCTFESKEDNNANHEQSMEEEKEIEKLFPKKSLRDVEEQMELENDI